MGAALCSNQNKIVQDTHKSTKAANKFKETAEDDINDKDANGFMKSDVARPHEKLW